MVRVHPLPLVGLAVRVAVAAVGRRVGVTAGDLAVVVAALGVAAVGVATVGVAGVAVAAVGVGRGGVTGVGVAGIGVAARLVAVAAFVVVATCARAGGGVAVTAVRVGVRIRVGIGVGVGIRVGVRVGVLLSIGTKAGGQRPAVVGVGVRVRVGVGIRRYDASNGFRDVADRGGEQVDHGDEGGRVAVAAGAVPGGLEDRVQALQAGVGMG